ncbi:hypothetical protein PLEOSDRAFT_1084740 [Pleurotus ostreatus PC15]|uniref:Uncharacterized protein n=1 Tax=Pleurotus ostreatus (strain PC15) TaxID=1137138 RepID=A0A067NGB4_PLEO1|nr:hypothetical protein PLEOSDRAFT_1084740 [Pleurotus ostreatus PC15]
MDPLFNPNNSQPDYGAHDMSMMVDDAEIAPGASQPIADSNFFCSSPAALHQSDDEYATPPHHKIPLEDVDTMMSIYDQTAATDPSQLFDGDDTNSTPNDPPAGSSDTSDEDYKPSDLGAGDEAGDEENDEEQDEEPPAGSSDAGDDDAGDEEQGDNEELQEDDHEPSDFGDRDGEGEDEEDADAVSDTDTEDPAALPQHGGGKRDVLDPNDILKDGAK